MPHVDRKAVGPITPALAAVAKQLSLHLRLVREMHQDGYIRIYPELPDNAIDKRVYTHERSAIGAICAYYGISIDKLIRVYNKGPHQSQRNRSTKRDI